MDNRITPRPALGAVPLPGTLPPGSQAAARPEPGARLNTQDAFNASAASRTPPATSATPPVPAAAAPRADQSVSIDPAKWAEVPIEAVSLTLADAKLEGLTEAEAQTVSRALERVREIGQAIGRGEAPGAFQAELFALKHTLADPGKAGNMPLATAGAQIIAQAEAFKATAAMTIKEGEAALATSSDPAALAREGVALTARYRVMVQLERALFDANLSGLSPEAQQQALEQLGALRETATGLAQGSLEPLAADVRVSEAAERLRAIAPQATAAAAPAPTQRAQDAVQQGKRQLQQKLAALDEKLFKGASPETIARERASLLNTAEALVTLGDTLASTRPPFSGPARAEYQKAVERVASLAEALGSGQAPAELRSTLFVTAQSLRDPVGSLVNPAIQAAAGAIQVIGQKEMDLEMARTALFEAAARDPQATQDALGQLHRRLEDLESMRQTLESVDYAALRADQAPQVSTLIGRMQAIAERVASGEVQPAERAEFESLGKQLRELTRPAAAPPAPVLPPPATAAAPLAPVLPPLVVPAPATAAVPIPQPPAGPAPAAPVNYTVKKGDYLSKIAREKLGDANRWKEIVALNQDKYPSLKTNPDLIQPNWVLKMPGKQETARPAAAPTAPAAPTLPAPNAPGQAPTSAAPSAPSAPVPSAPTTQPQTPAGPVPSAVAQVPSAPVQPAASAPPQSAPTTQPQTPAGPVPPAVAQVPSTPVAPAPPAPGVGNEAAAAPVEGGARPAVPSPAPARPLSAEDRARADLDRFLAVPDNRKPDTLRRAVVREPAIFQVASPEQKARVLAMLVEGLTLKADRSGAAAIVDMALERNELPAVLQAAERQGQLAHILNDMGDEAEGRNLSAALINTGVYREEFVWRAFDDDAVRGLLVELGFQAPMIGSSEALSALSEEARHHMVKQLTSGYMSVDELDMARWLNAHNQNPVVLPEFNAGIDASTSGG